MLIAGSAPDRCVAPRRGVRQKDTHVAKHQRTVSVPEPEPSAAPKDGLDSEAVYIPAGADPEAVAGEEITEQAGGGQAAVTEETDAGAESAVTAEESAGEGDAEPVELKGHGLDILDARGETDLPDEAADPAGTEDQAEDDDSDDPEQNEDAAKKTRATVSIRKTRSSKAPTKRRGVKTPARKESKVTATERRTTPFQFVRESVAELRKVVWPTVPQLRTYFVVVLIFVTFVIALVGLLDFGLGWALLRIFG